MKLAVPHCPSRKTNSSGESPSEQPGTSAFSQREDKHSELGLLRAALAQSCAHPSPSQSRTNCASRVPTAQGLKMLVKSTRGPLKQEDLE